MTYNKLPRIVKEAIENTVTDIRILYYKPKMPKFDFVNGLIVASTGSGKTNTAKLIAINGGFTKVVILSGNRRFRDLEIFHRIKVEYVEALNDLVKYVNVNLEIDYIRGHKVLIIIDDINKIMENELEKGMQKREFWDKIVMITQNIRQYNTSMVIIGHTYEDLKNVLINEAVLPSIGFLALGRLSLSEYKIRNLPRRLSLALTPSILRELKNLRIGEFYIITKQSALKIQMPLLPSHFLTQILREWIIVENGGNTRELIKKLAQRGLNYREIAEIVGTSPQYVAKVLTMLRKSRELPGYKPKPRRRKPLIIEHR